MPITDVSVQSRRGCGTGTPQECLDRASNTAYSLSTACADARMRPAGFLRSTNLSLAPMKETRNVGLLCRCKEGQKARGFGGDTMRNKN